MSEWKSASTKGGTYETWVPENEGDELVGIYQLKSTDVGPNKSNVYEIKKDSGMICSVWGSTVIDSQFNNPEEPINYGEEVKIVFRGMRKGKGPKPYKDFSVFHRVPEKSEAEVVFDA